MTINVKGSEQIDQETKDEMDMLKHGIADLFIDNEVEVETAISVLVTLYVITAKEMMGMSKEETIQAITTAIEMSYAQDEKEGLQWLN